MERVTQKGCGKSSAGAAADVDTRLAVARTRCAQRGARLTPLRAEVLQILLQHKRFLTAYELVERMREGHHFTSAMTVYRTLDFLIAQELVHRLDTVNGYSAARGLAGKGRCVVAICTRCSNAMEVDVRTLEALLDAELARFGFVADAGVIELKVMCDCCSPGALRKTVQP